MADKKGNGHFNAANVWGKIANLTYIKPDRGAPYLSIQMDCSGPRGMIRVFGRMYGREKAEALQAFHDANKNETIRLRGFLSQYEQRNLIYNNYTFFRWAHEPDQEVRAAFVLTGEVTATDIIGREFKINLQVNRQGRGDYSDVEENLEIWGFDPAVLVDVKEGRLVQFKGYLQQGKGEDEFGSSSGPVRLYALRSDVKPPF